MTSLIKNQIIKRLSKFVKNLSSNQINLSTFKGEGELSGINLDEKALEDVIELPVWLKIQKATCGRVFIKIPWTNLKTLPIQIQLDDVIIEIVTCEKLRDAHNPSSVNDPTMGKYGFTNRVIDGISLSITNLTFEVKAKGFKASVCLPTLDIYSVTPNGTRVDTLTLTRVRNASKDHILLFKEISWANARIEASSNDSNLSATAIRFIANSCRVRISMKKNLHDSSMVASRVVIHFDDFLSVVNDAQLKSVLNTYKEITQLMEKASEQKKRNAGDKLIKSERQPQTPTYQTKPSATSANELSNSNNLSSTADPFTRLDIIETSLHFSIKRLDLHIIADSGVLPNRLVENGALQLTIANVSVDHYPYHEFRSSKKHWMKYNEIQSLNRNEWAAKLYEQWYEQFHVAKSSVPNDETSAKFEKALRTNRIRLFESCIIINIDDLVFYPISLNNDKHQKRRQPIIASDKTYYQVPDSFSLINIQHTEYYYPLPYVFPVPNSDLYIQIMPLAIRLDFETFSWLHAFFSTLSITIDDSGVLETGGSSTDSEHIGIKLEAMLPRIIISSNIFSNSHKSQEMNNDKEVESEMSNQQEFEKLELNISKVLVTNTTTEPTSDRKKLEQHLNLFKKTSFFQQNQWPFSASTATTTRISSQFEKHPYQTYLYNNPLGDKSNALPEPPSARKAMHTYYKMTTDSLKKSAKYDVWHFNADNIYLDFTPSSFDSVRLVKQNMVDTLSLTGWATLDTNDKVPCANVLGILEAPSILKISQKQYTFIMHLVDELGLFLDKIERNTNQTRLIKQQSSMNNSSDDVRITICLTASNTFTLTVIDGLENAIDNISAPSTSNLLEVEIESAMHDTFTDSETISTPPVISTVKVEPSIINKNLLIPGQKKSKFEEHLQRGLEIGSKGSRGSSVASSANMSDNNDDTLSQLDMTEDLDADLDASLFTNDFEQQQKPTRIELDDDCISLTAKNYVRTTASESINGVFVKLNQINVCITDDNAKNDNAMYIACNVKHLRIDEFSSLKFDTIKPKLFENENPDELNHENVPPIHVRIDFPKGEPSPPPIVSLQVQDRSLTIVSHAIDILAQNLEEILTDEETLIRQNQPPKIVPIDVYLKNLQLTIELLHEVSTTQAVVEIKPPVQVNIERLHVLRQMDGRVVIQNSENPSTSVSNSNDDMHEKLQQFELLRLDNERLRSELDTHKTQMDILRRERDTLVNTIAKLDSELTQAEYQRIPQFQTRNK